MRRCAHVPADDGERVDTRCRSDSQSKPSATPRWVKGIDASHHQASIDWQRARRAGIAFAYLKATEGSSYVDPTFRSRWEDAARAGLKVGGYHFFGLCSPGAAQGEHFATTLASAGAADSLPPAVDVELSSECRPSRADVLDQVRAFVDTVEARTGRRVVVYVYPDAEAAYHLRNDLGRRLWVRSIGDTPPSGSWWMWQKSDSARIDGIPGPADLNILRGQPPDG